MKFKYVLPPELIEKASSFVKFSNGGAQATVKIIDGRIFEKVLLSDSKYLVAMRGAKDLPFSVSEIVDIYQQEEDKLSHERGNWSFWDDWS